MDTANQLTARQRFTDYYKWIIVVMGFVALLSSTYLLPAPKFDLRFLFLAAVMMMVSSRFSVQIPRVNTNVTVSDTFVFLVLLLYGGFAGIILAGIEGLFSGLQVSKGLRTSKKILIVSFNSAMMLCSTSLTVLMVRIFFAPTAELRFHELSFFITAVAVMALVQYLSNTGISTIGLALKTGQPFWRTWQRHYLWTSITYISGATVAAISANSFEKAGLTILMIGAPVIFIVYFTYHKYLNALESAAGKCERMPQVMEAYRTYASEVPRLHGRLKSLARRGTFTEG